MAFCGSLTASSSRTAWTWTQRGWSVWQRTGRRSSTGENSKYSTFISAIAIVLLLNIIIIESILDNHNSKAEYFPCSRMKKIADGLIHYRRSSESSSITSSSAGSVGLFNLIKYFLDDAKKTHKFPRGYQEPQWIHMSGLFHSRSSSSSSTILHQRPWKPY